MVMLSKTLQVTVGYTVYDVGSVNEEKILHNICWASKKLFLYIHFNLPPVVCSRLLRCNQKVPNLANTKET